MPAGKMFMGSARRQPLPVVVKAKPSIQKQVSSVKKSIRKMQNDEELKYFDVSFNTATADTAGVIQILNGMAGGNTQITRIGNEISCTSIQFRGRIVQNSDAELNATEVRLAVLWDRQPNGANPTIAGLDNGILNNVTVTDLLLSPYTYENQDRYRILYDKRFVLNAQQWFDYNIAGATTTLDSVVPMQMDFKKKIKLSRNTKYDNAAAGITSISSNSLVFIAISNQATTIPTITVGFRLYFKDS